MADPSNARTKPDPRLNPWRDDIAAEHLRGEIEAPTYVRGHDRTVVAPVTALRRAPAQGAMMDSQLLLGEKFRVYEERGAWVWGQARHDDYVGYMLADDLGPDITTTHRVTALRSFIYTDPDIKSRPLMAVSMGARLGVTGNEGVFDILADGSYIFADHIGPQDAHVSDFVGVAERFLGVPYLWGGRESLGLDCSALVQIALSMSGQACPRDSDMQEAVLGVPISGLARRGDLVFWKGHVGILRDADTLLHANATHMCVASEPFAQASARIGEAAGDIRQIRRLV
ncbi:MAG TPA: peptidase P60 [Rhodobiaceae bacterium]|nr:MAG: Gamma-D-glutamyl-L-lysine endopeptidase [Rhodobiaceae bacterium UBA7378]HCQ81409.1 peptidase P60 [Rhodobiaceae bacterium]|tara:strand:- start:3333 stop:4187 length:855 start_codon:yes stop_codon:yes gene_type:complete